MPLRRPALFLSRAWRYSIIPFSKRPWRLTMFARLVLVLTCLPLLPAVAAPTPSGQTGPVPVQRSQFIATMDAEFKVRDADKNGVVTKAEIEAYQRSLFARANQERLAALFQQLDADRNGQLSKAEFGGLNLPTMPVDATPLLSTVDLDRNGRVTLVEYRTGKLRNFDRMDADKDGVVSVAEMKAGGLIK